MEEGWDVHGRRAEVTGVEGLGEGDGKKREGEYTYEKIYRRFILSLDNEEETPAFEDNFNTYEHALATYFILEKKGWWPEYKELVEKHGNFLDKRMKNKFVAAVNHHWVLYRPLLRLGGGDPGTP